MFQIWASSVPTYMLETKQIKVGRDFNSPGKNVAAMCQPLDVFLPDSH